MPVKVANFITYTKTGVSVQVWAGWKYLSLQLFITALPWKQVPSVSPHSALWVQQYMWLFPGCDTHSCVGEFAGVAILAQERRAMRHLGWLVGSAASRTAAEDPVQNCIVQLIWYLIAMEPNNVLANKGSKETCCCWLHLYFKRVRMSNSAQIILW